MSAEFFAGRLRELRIREGLTQKALADKAGIALSEVGHLEAGRRSPSWETVIALADALGVGVADFLIAPKDAPEPARGRPRKSSHAEKPEKPAGKRGKRT